MNHFNLKSLSFYGIAIASVLVLFKIVTLYGESRLKASPPIAGTYRLTESDSCLGRNTRLAIEQSGIYLQGTLSTGGTSVPLDGRFQGNSFRLRGSGGKSCAEPMVIEASVKGESLRGTVDGVSVIWEKEVESEENPSGDH